jgi:ADP-ribose pyrophosphatase YjhB (NUDIX family)
MSSTNPDDTNPISPQPPADETQVCDGTSVGVIITNGSDEYLMVERTTSPVGIAPPARHVDGHGSASDIAYAQARDAAGVEVAWLATVAATWRDNICQRQPGPQGTGHHWTVYSGLVDDTAATAAARPTGARWYSRHEVQNLAERTAAYATGEISAAEFTAAPGIEPVWVDWLCRAQVITMSAWDRDNIDALAGHPIPEDEEL